VLSDSQQSAGEIVYASANEPTARDGQGELDHDAGSDYQWYYMYV